MAIGKSSDFKVYNEFIHTAIVETLTQESDIFNEASRGTILLTSVSRRGEYVYESFFANVSSLITRRDTTSVAGLTDAALTQSELVSVKVNRKIGPVANTLDSFRKIMAAPFDEDALNYSIGTQAAKAMAVDMCNTALLAVRAALNNQSTVKYTVPSNGTLSTNMLVRGLAKLGDAASKVILWVMHSKTYFDLTESQITANIDGVSNFVVASASPVTLNRPVLVVDSANLASPSPLDYYTLGLVQGAVEVEDSEDSMMWSDIVTGLENLVVRFQGECAYNLGLKGMKWDVSGGGANPADATIGTGSNWDPAFTDRKDWGGIIIQSR